MTSIPQTSLPNIILNGGPVAPGLAEVSQAALDLKANEAEVVHNTGTETIAGSKTFTSATTLPVRDKGGQVFNVKAYGALGDGTTDDTLAIQAAIDAVPASGGAVYFPRGAYVITAPLVPKSFLHIYGEAWGRAKIISTTSDLFDMDIGSLMDRLEIDHLALDVTGGHAFKDGRLIRASFHHLDIFVRSSDKSVWSSLDTQLMIECYFSEIQYRVYGATRSVPAWHLLSSGIDLITANVWDKLICWNDGYDATQYQFLIVCSNANGANRTNAFRNITFEQCCGGCIRLESSTNTVIDNCYSWDTPDDTIAQNLFAIAKNTSNSLVPRNITISNSGRVGNGLMTGIYDIAMSSTCLQTTIDNVSGSTTQPVRLNIGGAVGTFLNNVQASATLDGALSGNYVMTQRGSVTAQSIDTQDVYTAYVLDTTGARSAYWAESASTNARALSGAVTGESLSRFVAYIAGMHEWGDGTNPRDTNLYRAAANLLQTDDKFRAAAGIGMGTGVAVPGSAAATGTAGDIAYDSSYIYICTATNTWRRIAHSTW